MTSRDSSSPVQDGGVEVEPSNTQPTPPHSKIRTTLSAAGIGFGTIILVGIWTGIVGGIYYVLNNGISAQADMLLSNVALILGTASIMWLYFRYSERGPEFIDLNSPTAKALGIALLGVVLLLVASIAIEQGFKLVGVTAAEHQIYELATAEDGGLSPQFILLMVPIAIFVIGPAEELVYRGLIQKSLYSQFTTKYAIVLASLIFALVHFPVYLTGTIGDATVTVATVYALSLILGAIYAYTDNIAIPSLTHGLYNAVLFGLLYAEMTGLF